ncbi:MAG: S-layer homology domain-containing protein, partial [Syntrophomonas sp.]
MGLSIKHRRFMVITTMMAFIMTSVILPGLAYADSAGNITCDAPVIGNLLGEKQDRSKDTRITSQGFSDIKNHPSEAAIRALQAIGMVSGFPDGSFHPDKPVTQMEAVTLVMRLVDNGNEKARAAINQEELKNVPVWGKTAAQKALQMGIISADDFQYTALATRVRVMVWLAETAGIEREEAGNLSFKDSQLILSADAGYIRALYNMGIIKGTPEGNLEPNGVMSRAQLAVILKNILDKNLVSSSVNSIDKELVSLDILTVNDFHGALLEDNKNPGAAKLATWLKDQKAANPEGTLILSAGDMSQGSIDSNLSYGKTVIEAMNEIGFDAMAVGNHEFDWGLDCLKNQAAWAKFPILTANITDKKTGHGLEGTKPWIIVERKGVKIGIIGVTTEETTDQASPKVISACKIDKPGEIITRLVPELKQQGVQVIIILGHLGGY